MRLTVIGCSGSFPGPDSPSSCYLVEAEGFRLVLDLGNGSLGALQRHLALGDVDAVLLTHLHADHCLDLCSYYVARKWVPGGPLPPLPVYGPPGAADHMARAYGLPPVPGMREIFDFRALVPGELVIGPFTVSVDRTAHPVETFAVRLERDGRSIAYSADTGPCEGVPALAAGANLFLCEASYVEGDETGPPIHLTGKQAGRCATRAGVDSLVLTHLVPWNDRGRTLREASGAYTGPISLARQGSVHDLIG
ncbi:MAG: MBL fold metallo-hydrolase [Streptosporangiaceae bacterium]